MVIAVLALVSIVGTAPALAQNAYITNANDSTVSVIDTATNTVIGSPIPVGSAPEGVAVTPDGSTIYVANLGANTVSVIDTATNTVIGPPSQSAELPTAWRSPRTAARSMSRTKTTTRYR
jgi:YVTN family beta-propeller protein